MQRDIERRAVPGKVELRAAADGTKKLVGYAALYDSMSEDLGGFREIIRAGAFTRALASGPDVMIRAEHDSAMLLGRTSSGTARVTADEKGLRYEVDLPDTQAARDLAVLCARGDVTQSSFAFRLSDDADAETWSRCEDGTPLRELRGMSIVDCAPVADPAYRATSVSVRALEHAKTIVTPPVVDKRADAMERFRAERKTEKRDMAYEEKLEALWYALYDLLGSPWDSEAPWSIEATFDDRVIVERQPGQYQAYPISFDAANALTIGAPAVVVVQYVPVAADDSAARALDLARLEFGI